MKPTPKVKKNGTCVQCGKTLPRLDDPFCSATCARAYYEVVDQRASTSS